MKNELSRPRSIALHELDGALEEALLRAGQSRVLTQAECNSVSGGAVAGDTLILDDLNDPFPGTLVGFMEYPFPFPFPVDGDLF